VAGDTLDLGWTRMPVTGFARIDVARGATVSRKQSAVFIVTGLVIGTAAGAIMKDRVCAGCDTIFSFLQLGMMTGAGVGYLASRLLPKEPRWYPVWPMEQRPRQSDTNSCMDSGKGATM